MPMPCPALCSTMTSWPCATSFPHAAGHEADAVFEDLDLFRDADAHGISPGKLRDRKSRTRGRLGGRAPGHAASRSQRCRIADSIASTTPPRRCPLQRPRGRPEGDHHGPRRTDYPRPGCDEANLARRVLDAVHAQPRIQGRSADGRPRGRDVPVERPRRQDHRRVVGPLLRLRRPRPQGDRRGGRQATARARLLRAVPARAPEAVRARVAHRRAHAGRSQPDLLRQFRLRVRRHGDEARARLPPGARPGRAQRLRLARARLPRRQFRRRGAVGARQQPAQVRPRASPASRTCGTRT